MKRKMVEVFAKVLLAIVVASFAWSYADMSLELPAFEPRSAGAIDVKFEMDIAATMAYTQQDGMPGVSCYWACSMDCYVEAESQLAGCADGDIEASDVHVEVGTQARLQMPHTIHMTHRLLGGAKSKGQRPQSPHVCQFCGKTGHQYLTCKDDFYFFADLDKIKGMPVLWLICRSGLL